MSVKKKKHEDKDEEKEPLENAAQENQEDETPQENTEGEPKDKGGDSEDVAEQAVRRQPRPEPTTDVKPLQQLPPSKTSGPKVVAPKGETTPVPGDHNRIREARQWKGNLADHQERSGRPHIVQNAICRFIGNRAVSTIVEKGGEKEAAQLFVDAISDKEIQDRLKEAKVGDLGDGSLLDWLKDHKDGIWQVILAIVSAFMMFAKPPKEPKA